MCSWLTFNVCTSWVAQRLCVLGMFYVEKIKFSSSLNYLYGTLLVLMMIVINGKWVGAWVTGKQTIVACSPFMSVCVLSSSSLLLLWRLFLHFVKGKITLWMILHSYVHNASKKKKIMYGGIVKEFILCLLPHRQWKKSFVMPNTTTEERKKGERKKEKHRERERGKKIGEHGEEVAEANLAPPSNIFTLTTV